MTTRRHLLAGAAALFLTPVSALAAPKRVKRKAILSTMKRATRFMVEKMAYRGGYVWAYAADGSRRWGEMEAFATMIWIQPPGTATMGHLFLDAYYATGDDYYYQVATQVADGLMAAQHPAGGWHYFHDFGGAQSRKKWYDTIGKNAWRLEEFQYDWGNATFDDAGTSESMQFLLRLYVEKKDERFRPALDKALNFVLESQYPIGGWPQRYPANPVSLHGHDDYTGDITFNDDVAGENIRFLIMYHQTLGDPRIPDAITRAMSVYLVTQQGEPQPGWGLQHSLDLKPAGARTYEPQALATHTTYANIRQLMDFYRLTGESKYLARIPQALDWLDSVRLPDADGKTNRHPTFIELGTNKGLFIHRRGSNIVNGQYYYDYDPTFTLGHYSSFRILDVAKLRAEYEKLKATPPEVATQTSPLRVKTPLDRYFVAQMNAGSDLNAPDKALDVAGIVRGLNKKGYWPTLLKATSHPYGGDGISTPAPGDFRTTRVGDKTDTSPFIAEKPVMGISTSAYIDNMAKLISALGAK
ncbi:pectate lyase [Asticcacaulis sp. AC402]|uniref:pectate lyase n=1 Tax=Asticcacaulis sp. AC402 TaxID=1282361 RepID=UPI0004061528|nr:pectate lyase [Asticcacaulis sp. AC402]